MTMDKIILKPMHEAIQPSSSPFFIDGILNFVTNLSLDNYVKGILSLCCFCYLNFPDLFKNPFQILMNALKVVWELVAKPVSMFQGPTSAPVCPATLWILTNGLAM